MPQKAIERVPEDRSDNTRALDAVIAELAAITHAARQLERDFSSELAGVDPRYRDSACNLLHYIALRRLDLRPLQARLASYGLSSLGRAEPHVMATLEAVQRVLQQLVSGGRLHSPSAAGDFAASQQRHELNAADMLGPAPIGRTARIMVTLPTEAASDAALVRRLMDAGMDVARINCAHDSEQTWAAMIDNLRLACEASNSECRILMDLAGPKLRTGKLTAGPRIMHIQPRRDAWGRVIAPKRLRLAIDVPGVSSARHVIPIDDEKVLIARPGDCFRFHDTRNKKREFRVIGNDMHGLEVECDKAAFIETGTRLKLHRQGATGVLVVRVGELPAVEQPILLRKGDELILHRDAKPGQPATANAGGVVKKRAHVSCTLPEAFRCVLAGEPVFLNDGKIGGVVLSVTEEQMIIRIDKASPSGSRLRAGKSINFPASDLPVSGMTDKDRHGLKFIVEHADAVGLSFLREPNDVYEFQAGLARFTGRTPGIVLKIETRQGFANLARLLLAAMRTYPAGVMIARGDLAVECGWERLAEIQEEILWLCEAAQLPVIWATQVLEGKARKGMPSRAEISDASMSQRADCVMLNKGPHIIEAMQMLDNILRRMQEHQSKKSATLRKLSVSDALA